MKLYGFPTPRNVCVWAMIEYLGLNVDQVPVDLMQGQQKSGDYLALNPNGLTPTLVDGDFCLWEHAAILQYLAETSGSSLAPSTPRGRADATRWVSWTQMHWVPGVDVLGFEHLAKPAMGMGKADSAEVERGRSLVQGCIPIVDQHLAKTTFMLGEELSFIDFFFAGSIAHWQTCAIPLEDAPNILRWFALIQALPAWVNQFSNASKVGAQ